MSGKNFFQIDPENRPNRTTRERVVSERGRKELPPGTKSNGMKSSSDEEKIRRNRIRSTV